MHTKGKNKLVILSALALILLNNLYAAEAINLNQIKLLTGSDLALRNLKNLSDAYEFKPVKKVTLQNGKMRYKLMQYYNGIPVFDSGIVTSKENAKHIGSDDYITGRYVANIEEDLQSIRPGITKIQAVNYAKLSEGVTNIKQIENTNVELLIKVFNNSVAKLVYKVDFFINKNEPSRPFLLVDANTGEILEKWEGLTANNYNDYRYFWQSRKNIYRSIKDS